MTQKVRPLNLGFTAADALRPKITYDKGVLTLTFKDWQEKSIEVRFPEVAAFSWVYDDVDEEVSEIIDSDWLRTLQIKDWIDQDTKRKHHYRVAFNEGGTLNVISEPPKLKS